MNFTNSLQSLCHKVFSPKNSRSARKGWKPRQNVEALESRVLLSNVSVSISNGTLNIRGDNEDNRVDITFDEEGNVAIIGKVPFGGTTIKTTINGAEEFLISHDDFENIHSINFTGRGGNDRLEISGYETNSGVPFGLDLSRDLIFRGGKGADSLDIIRVPGAIGRDFIFQGGRGGDNIYMDDFSVGRNLIVDTGRGDDNIGFWGLEVGNRVLVHTGRGDDDLVLANPVVGGGASISTGSGDDFVFTGKISSHSNSVYGGSVNIDLGSGDDRLQFEATVEGSLSINAGRGSDFIWISPTSNTDIAGNLNVRAGSGDDEIKIGRIGRRGTVVNGDVNLDGGRGRDILNLFDPVDVDGAFRKRRFEDGNFRAYFGEPEIITDPAPIDPNLHVVID